MSTIVKLDGVGPIDNRSVVSTTFCKAKSATTKKTFFLRGDFRSLPNKNVQMLDRFFPLLFPKDSESLKILDIRLHEVGAKRPLNGTSKVNKHTNTQTDRRTFRLIESIGPEGRCFENFRIEIWTFLFQICFQNQFLTLGSGQTENTRICVFANFPFDHFPKIY